MEVGVFGKLPTRRDYVQQGLDRRLMEVLDPWLQNGVAASREALGEGWLDAWLCAPIWRFWLGRRIAGRTALGAMMPSVDGVGRYFPLCVIGSAERLAPPEMDDHAGWFDAVETLMLAALAEGGSYEPLLAGLETLPAAGRSPAPAGSAQSGGVSEQFSVLRAEMQDEILEDHSCWWVPSPDGVQPIRALIRRGMPEAGEYADLILQNAMTEPLPVASAGAG